MVDHFTIAETKNIYRMLSVKIENTQFGVKGIQSKGSDSTWGTRTTYTKCLHKSKNHDPCAVYTAHGTQRVNWNTSDHYNLFNTLV